MTSSASTHGLLNQQEKKARHWRKKKSNKNNRNENTSDTAAAFSSTQYGKEKGERMGGGEEFVYAETSQKRKCSPQAWPESLKSRLEKPL